MIRQRPVPAILAAALTLALAVPAAAPAVLAQDQPPTPEGTTWHLTTYIQEGALAEVPWTIDATLLLEDGTASGSSGCNRFSGGYTLEGEGLVFDPALATTRMACPGPEASVEDGYLAALPTVATWAIDGDRLALADAAGAVVLEYEQALIGLTAADLAAIAARFDEQQAQSERLSRRLDAIRIGFLRDRISALEEQIRVLEAARAEAEAAFTAAEGTLLKGVSGNIRGTCSPLRGSSLPSGTVAALRCRPGTGLVETLAYYLMDYPAGKRTFQRVMTAQGAPDRFACDRGRAGGMLLHPLGAEGCFVDDGQANVRLMYMATSCRQLDAGATHLVSPVVYVALEGSGARIKPLYEWTRAPDRPSSLVGAIPAPGQPTTPICEGGF